MIKQLLVIVFLFTFQSLQGQEIKEKSNLGFLISGALEFGGEPVASISFTNGDVIDMHAGQGGTISVGLEYKIPKAEQLRLRGLIGFKYLTTPAENVHIRLTRVPIVFTGNYVIKDAWRFGMGISTHQAVKFNAGGLGSNFKLDSTAGPVFEFGYKWVALSYTLMQYSNEFNQYYSANAFGITLSHVFSFNR
ncbi:hypothetical protein ACFOUP_18590 [Belliella kenyensis]|uniref:Outer membrane protein beta-barrel domain-containing protein n=1 Tax=Belliella kenyensis TaxID=1472724 RepID=A0ABV8ETE5_9BACT|nr:hypothetical protein [Belliella kenyensis]MCH7402214.1 hypothetical protein [Belliella kenyensis]MDN3601728.1 hypothetical protein [Belliella kenyensis]